jgi:hypothetical protein
VRTFQRMRDEMVFAALRCKRPKWVVLAGLLAGRRWTEAELFYSPDEVGGEVERTWGAVGSWGAACGGSA